MMKKIIATFLLLVWSNAAVAAEETVFVPTEPLGDLEVGLKIQEVVSKKGIKAWLVQDDSLPVTAIQFLFRDAGATSDPEGLEGLADMASATIDEGAGPLDSKAFQGTLSEKSIRIRFSAGRESFGGSFYSLNRYRDEAANMLQLALSQPRFDEEPVERIRNQLLIGLRRSKQDPSSVANRALLARMFPQGPYDTPVDGTEETVAKITQADLKRFVAGQLTRSRLVVGVVGAISVEELSDLLDRVFGDLPPGEAPEPKSDVVMASEAGVEIIDMDVPQSAIAFMQPGLKRDDPDYYAATVLNYILGGGSFASRLTDEIREKRGLVYSVYSYLFPLDRVGLWGGGAATQNARAAETVEVLKQEWTRMAADGVTAGELSRAKTYLTGAYPLRFTNSSSIARILTGVQREGLGLDYVAVRNDLIRNVTLEDVNRVAKKILDPGKLAIMVVGRPEGLEAASSQE